MPATIGRILLMPKGAYNGTTIYNSLDWVRDNGKAWVCKVDGTQGITPTEGANWTVLAEDGNVSGTVDWPNVNFKPFDDVEVGGGLFVNVSKNLELDTSYLVGSNIGYDNTSSGLSATDVQSAIDEIASSSGTSLGGLSDVTLTTPAGGQTLKYNGSMWVNSDEVINLFDTETSSDGTTVTFSGIDTSKGYLLIADYPNNYDGAPVGMTNIEYSNDGATPPVYSVTFTLTNATVNQSFDLYQIG